MESRALAASRPMEYSGPSRLFLLEGQDGRNRGYRKGPERDLDRDRHVYAQPDFDNQRQHDDVHGQHRPQQQALVAEQGGGNP